jgi:hypothetical protein
MKGTFSMGSESSRSPEGMDQLQPEKHQPLRFQAVKKQTLDESGFSN